MNETVKTTCLLLAALLAGYIGSLLAQLHPPRVIKAQRIEVVDSTGASRIVLECQGEQPDAPDPFHGMRLYDSARRERGSFGMRGDKTIALNLRDTAGKSRGVFAMLDDNPQLFLSDATEKIRGSFMVRPNGHTMLGLLDETGEVRTLLSVKDQPEFAMYDATGKSRVSLDVLPDGGAIDESARRGRKDTDGHRPGQSRQRNAIPA